MRVIVNIHGNDLTVGGAERAVDLLSRGLAARGHEVSLFLTRCVLRGTRAETHVPLRLVHAIRER